MIDLPHAFLLVAREFRDGRLAPGVRSFGLEGDVLRYVPNPATQTEVPADLIARVSAAGDSIAAGTLNPLPPAEGETK